MAGIWQGKRINDSWQGLFMPLIITQLFNTSLHIMFDFLINTVFNIVIRFIKINMQDSKQIIESFGGPSNLARILGFKKFGSQRVHNWIKRGIPAKIFLDYPDLFKSESISKRHGSGNV